MKTHTSKSASATRKTSSQSGTFAQTVDTANNGKKPRRGVGKFAYVVNHINKKTVAERLETLVAAGVITKTHKLAAKYRKPKGKGVRKAHK